MKFKFLFFSLLIFNLTIAQVEITINDSDDISSEKTFAREVDSLLKIKDAYPKLLIARTRREQYQYEGIKIIDIAEWLE